MRVRQAHQRSPKATHPRAAERPSGERQVRGRVGRHLIRCPGDPEPDPVSTERFSVVSTVIYIINSKVGLILHHKLLGYTYTLTGVELGTR